MEAEVDGEPIMEEKDCASRNYARSLAIKMGAANGYGAVVERKHLTDVTPAGDPPGLLWDYETEVLEEYPR